MAGSVGGDLQAMLVLAMVGQARIATLTQPVSDDPDNDHSGAISASRLTDVTGIPRETEPHWVCRRSVALIADEAARAWSGHFQFPLGGPRASLA